MTRKRLIKILMSSKMQKRSAKLCLIYFDMGVFSNYSDVLSLYLEDIKHTNFKEYTVVKQNEKNAWDIFRKWRDAP